MEISDMPLRTHIFIDFWNFQISLIDATSVEYRLDWKKISPWIMSETQSIIGQPLTYDGTQIYISYDPSNTKDAGLRDFAINTLDRFPGIQVNMTQRRPKNAPTCPQCHIAVDNCPRCGNTMTRTLEKGVDTAIVTDMLKLAWEGVLDVAVLVSSDRDFIPAVEVLTAKGYKVINARFPPAGMNLARTCWASIDLKNGIGVFQR
jgi:uncharacterized LabA/DUF88 family protein